MQSSSERVSKHIDNQIKMALEFAERNSEFNTLVKDNNTLQKAVIYMEKLAQVQSSLLEIIKINKSIIMSKHGFFSTKKNGIVTFSWHFDLNGLPFSIHTFTDGSYINHRPYNGSVYDAICHFEKMINNFCQSKIRLN